MRFTNRLTTLLLATLAASAAQAEILFACTTTQGKRVQIEAQGETLHYRYGPASAPELEFSQPRSETNSGACSSQGKRHDWLVMTNKGYEYMITTESSRRQKASLDVHIEGRKSSSRTLTCRAKSIQNHLSQLSSIASPCGQ